MRTERSISVIAHEKHYFPSQFYPFLETCTYSKEFIDKQSAACTNAIEGDWRHAKVHMPSYGTHLGDHAGYLAEFMWRRANADVDKFLKLLSDINMTFREKYLSQIPSTCSLDA